VTAVTRLCSKRADQLTETHCLDCKYINRKCSFEGAGAGFK